jgi:hypothetical protein
MAECPNEAIYSDFDLPDEYADYVDINEAFYVKGPGADLV